MISASQMDILVVVLYLAVMMLIGWRLGKGQGATKEEYYLGGRRFGWFALGMSLFATNLTTIQLVGQSGLAYEIGLAAANPQILGGAMLGFAAIFFMPAFLRGRIYTVPGFLELRFGRSTKVIYCLIVIVLSLIISPIVLYAGGKTVLALFELDPHYLPWCCVGMGCCVGLYSVRGGLRSVVATDVFQGSTLVVGGVIMLMAMVGKFLYGNGEAQAFPENHAELLLPASDMHMPATGVFTGLALAAIFFATSNATLLQRMLGARDLAHAQNGMVFAGMLKLFAVLIIVVPGMMSAALFPGIHPDTAYAVMLKELVPAGLSGLVLATFIAALMSTTDSEIHSMSAIVTLDLLPLARRSLSPDASLMVGKLVAVFFLCWAVLLAPLVERVGLIYPIVLQSAAYLLAPAGVCFMFGRFHRRATTFAANCVLLSGLILGTLMMGWSLADAFTSQRLMGIHFYHISPVLVLTYAGMFLLLSRYGRAPTAKQLEFLKPSPTGKAMGTAGYAGNRRALALFFILIVALYVVF